MSARTFNLDGTESNRGGRLLTEWAVSSSCFVRELQRWLERDGEADRAEFAWWQLVRFLGEEDLLPENMFEYTAEGLGDLQPETASEESIQSYEEYRNEIRLATPLVAGWRRLMSADTGSEYRNDKAHLERELETWRATQDSVSREMN